MNYTFDMTIYIESFLIQNVLINFCLLRLVLLTSKSKSSFWRLFFGAFVGAIASVIVAMFLENVVAINIIKLLCALVMVLIAFKCKAKGYAFNLILLFLYTYAFGGGIMSLTSAVYVTNFGVVMNSKISLEVICLLIIGLTYVFEMVAKHIKGKIKNGKFIYNTTLFLNGQKLKVNAFLDSGNMLSFNGQPVVVIDLKTYLKLSKTDLVQFYLKRFESIKTGTVNGSENLRIDKLDKMVIDCGKKKKVVYNPPIAITPNFKAENYSVLISPSLV